MGIKRSRKPASFVENRLTEILPASRPAETASVLQLSTGAPSVFFRCGANGQRELVALFPAVLSRGAPLEVELTYLEKVPHLTAAFADAFINELAVGKGRLIAPTIRAMSKRLCNGFFAYLRDVGNEIVALNDIDEAIGNGFIHWLNRSEGGKERYAVNTRANFYSAFTRCFSWISTSKKWSAEVGRNVAFKVQPWPGRSQRQKPVEVIDVELAAEIRRACMLEVADIVRKFHETRKIASAKQALPALKDVVASKIDESDIIRYAVLTRNTVFFEFRRFPSKLTSAMREKRLSIAEDITPRFYPTARTLIPFVLLMAFALSYNADTVRKAKVDDFKYEDTFGNFLTYYYSTDDGESNDDVEVVKGITANSLKGRARSRQLVTIPVDDEIDNPAVLYEFLVKWTEPLRMVVSPEIYRHLFIFANVVGRKPKSVSSFHGELGENEGSTFQTNLLNFREDHGLAHFTLNQIRPTVLDVGFEISGGDIRVPQIQANHRSKKTTGTHYTSDAEKMRMKERLGTGALLRERWRETRGTIDSRDLDSNLDQLCATPGWRCLDPYDSPFSQKGKLCRAYGYCPDCPLGGQDFKSEICCAYSFALLDAIDRTKLTMNAVEWKKKLNPIREKLVSTWLPRFPPQILKAAREIQIPRLPALE